MTTHTPTARNNEQPPHHPKQEAEMKDEYTRLDTLSSIHLEPCPCCGSSPRVWQYVDDGGDATQVVMCSFGDPIGPQNDELSNGCPLHSPSMEAYRTTVQEAVKYWNEFAKALLAIQRRNRYESHSVLRNTDTPSSAS